MPALPGRREVGGTRREARRRKSRTKALRMGKRKDLLWRRSDRLSGVAEGGEPAEAEGLARGNGRG